MREREKKGLDTHYFLYAITLSCWLNWDQNIGRITVAAVVPNLNPLKPVANDLFPNLLPLWVKLKRVQIQAASNLNAWKVEAGIWLQVWGQPRIHISLSLSAYKTQIHAHISMRPVRLPRGYRYLPPRSNSLSLISRIHVKVEGENWPNTAVLWHSHTSNFFYKEERCFLSTNPSLLIFVGYCLIVCPIPAHLP